MYSALHATGIRAVLELELPETGEWSGDVHTNRKGNVCQFFFGNRYFI